MSDTYVRELPCPDCGTQASEHIPDCAVLRVPIETLCRTCPNRLRLYIHPADWKEFTTVPKRDRRNIQDIFPYLTADEREMLLSHTCPKCWAEMFTEG
jgi:hypothetical protein